MNAKFFAHVLCRSLELGLALAIVAVVSSF